MQLVGIFRAAAKFGVIPSAHAGELRKRCRSCGWVNIYHPLTGTRRPLNVESK